MSNGADGQTLKEILKVLQIQSVYSLNSVNKKF